MTPEEAASVRSCSGSERGSIRCETPAAEALAHAREHLFERVSVAKEYELYTEALRHGRGRVELSELKAALLAEVDQRSYAHRTRRSNNPGEPCL